MDISEEVLTNTKQGIETRNKELADARQLTEKQNVSEGVQQWVKNEKEKPLSGRDLK